MHSILGKVGNSNILHNVNVLVNEHFVTYFLSGTMKECTLQAQ